MVKVAINGFGRIGRSVLRALLTSRAGTGIEVVRVNDIAPLETCAYLFAYDSVFGPAPFAVRHKGGVLYAGDVAVPFTGDSVMSATDLSGVDLVLECTGLVKAPGSAASFLEAGAGRLLISGPSEAAEVTVVPGANDTDLGAQAVVSAASCTTNALAPLLVALEAEFGLISGHMTTVHCYTGSQPMVDGPRGDLARSRAGALSMVPTTTSATGQLEKVIPQLADRVTGRAIRVPVPSVSAVDLTVQLRDRADVAERLRAVAEASAVIGWTDLPLVSTDLRQRPESLVLAGPEIIEGPELTRVFGWYDNEWGFANRMIDLALRMG